MDPRGDRAAGFLRANAFGLGVGVVLLALAVLAVRWIVQQRGGPPPRKVMQYTVVNVQPPPRAPPPPPPPPVTPPKVEEREETTRVDLKPADLLPPDVPPPPAAGPLALAAEGDGPGDAFNLVGNPGGRALVGPGGIGDGSGGEGGVGGGGAGSRFAWYYVRVATEIEDAFRRHKVLAAAAARVELRVWVDASGRIQRIQPVRSTGDPRVDEAIQSVVGLRLREPPPREIPMPMIARLTARRPG
jgi:TonB family protein